MKIDRVAAQIVRLPADEPLADGKTVPGATRDIVVVKVVTKDGIEGVGVTFFGAATTGAVCGYGSSPTRHSVTIALACRSSRGRDIARLDCRHSRAILRAA